MSEKKLMLNANGFGMSKAANKAVLHGYLEGFLSGASLCANGSAFNPAVNEIIPECPNLSIGVHLNLTKGTSLTKADLLTDKKGQFNKNFLYFLFKHDSKMLKQIEFEFRTQIETLMNYTKVYHIDSVEEVHAIPDIFKLTLKLAKEYNIPFVRSYYEEFFLTNSVSKYLNFNYPVNLSKSLLLNYFSHNNKILAKKSLVKTNDNVIGILHSNFMDSKIVEDGLSMIDSDNCLVDVIINPCYYGTQKQDKYFKEYLIAKDKDLKDKIQRIGFEITNYKYES